MKRLAKLFGETWLMVALMVFIVAACGRPPAPAGEPRGRVDTLTPAPLSSWDELVKAAQKEGTVTIYTTILVPAKGPLTEAFRKKFGINLEFVTGRGPELVAKLTRERRAGLYLADTGHIGEITSMVDIKPQGMTVPIPDLLVLPEVKNPNNWIGGKLPFIDKDQHVLMFMASAFPQTVVNTDLVKKEDLVSFLDLLNPRWKEKILLNDPTVAGGGPYTLAAMVKTFGKERALELFRQLAAQEPAVIRDYRTQLEWVARGKYAITLGYSAAIYSEFRRAGAPVKMMSFKEPRHIYGSAGILTIFSQNPNPKATQVYVNWLLTKEGSSIVTEWQESLSARTDVSRGGVDPEVIPRPGDYLPDEEIIQLHSDMRTISAEIFGHLIK